VVQDGAVVSAGSQSVDQRHAAVVTQACRLIESQGEMPDLDTLARSAGMSPSHFHRVFKAQTGLTPKAFASAHRARRLRAALNEPGVSVTEAIYDAGFNASSRFYEHADRLLGMRARNYRNGGSGEVIRFAVAQCSLGAILVAQGERGICAIMMDDDPEVLVRDLQDQFPKALSTSWGRCVAPWRPPGTPTLKSFRGSRSSWPRTTRAELAELRLIARPEQSRLTFFDTKIS